MQPPKKRAPMPASNPRPFSVAAALLMAGTCLAGDLFQFNGNSTDGTPSVEFNRGASSLPDAISDLIKGSGAFSDLQNRSFQADLQYGGVANALQFSIQQDGPEWYAQLLSPFDHSVINQTFNAPSRAELEQQIKDYLEKSGMKDLARFLAAMNKKSIAGSLDGNPVAATAVSANAYFNQYGLRSTSTFSEAEAEDSGEETSRAGFEMTAEAGVFQSQGLTGQTYSWTPVIPVTLGKSRRVRLEFALPMNWTILEGADQFRAGSQLGVAVLIKKRTKDQPWLWQVTPHAGVMVSGSFDLIAGGLLASGGGTSYLSYRWHEWEFSMGNHISFHEGMALDIEDYRFDPDVSQQIVKNGLKVGRSLGKNWYVEAYVVDTEFLQDAFVQRYLTVGAGVGYRGSQRRGYLMVGGYGTFGEEFSAAQLQFGTGWKF